MTFENKLVKDFLFIIWSLFIQLNANDKLPSFGSNDTFTLMSLSTELECCLDSMKKWTPCLECLYQWTFSPTTIGFTGPSDRRESFVKCHSIQKTMPQPFLFAFKSLNAIAPLIASVGNRSLKSNSINDFGSAKATQGYSQRGCGSTSSSLISHAFRMISSKCLQIKNEKQIFNS